jgi:peptide chain release factor 1
MNDYLQQEIKRLEQKINQAKATLNDPQLRSLAKAEIKKLQAQKKALTSVSSSTITQKSTPSASSAPNYQNIILEIRPGTGGEEAKIWAEDLMKMYIRFANSQALQVIKLDEGVIKIKGKQAYRLFQFEAGVHRVQRIPTTESHGRIHTSTASVAILPEIKETQIKIDPKDIELQFFRASSQGGQNVQKVNTAVRITHHPSGLVTVCQTQRSQEQNRKIALDLLRAKLYQKEQKEKQARLDQARRQAVGRGMRAEKIRTYNFPQNRVTDHRLKKSWKNLDKILEGNLLPIVTHLLPPTSPSV